MDGITASLYLVTFPSIAMKQGLSYLNNRVYTQFDFIETQKKVARGEKIPMYEQCMHILALVYGVFGKTGDSDVYLTRAEKILEEVEKDKPVEEKNLNSLYNNWLGDYSLSAFLLGLICVQKKQLIRGVYYLMSALKTERLFLSPHYFDFVACALNMIPGWKLEEASYHGCGFSATNPMGAINPRFLDAQSALNIIPDMEGVNGEIILAMNTDKGRLGYLNRRGSTYGGVGLPPIDIYGTYIIDKEFNLKSIYFYFNGYFSAFDYAKIADGFRIKPTSRLWGMYRFVYGKTIGDG